MKMHTCEAAAGAPRSFGVDQTINYRQKILFWGCQQLRERSEESASAPPRPGRGGLHRRAVLTALLAPRASAPRATAAAPPRAREPSVSASLAARRAAPRRAHARAASALGLLAKPFALWRGVCGGSGGASPPAEGRRRREVYNFIAQKANTSARASASGRVCIVPRQLSHSVYGVGPTHTAKSVGCVHLLGESEDPAKVDISRMALLSRDRALHRRCCSWRLRASCQACRSCWSATAAHAQHHACAVLPAASSRAGAMQSFTRA